MQSMTGFGRADATLDGFQYSFEIKSVNHRYLDMRFRLPPLLSALESSFAEVLRGCVQRGSLEVSVRIKAATSKEAIQSGIQYRVDLGAAQSLIEACQLLATRFGTTETPSLEMLERTGKVFLTVEEPKEAVAFSPSLRSLLEKACEALSQDRLREGTQTGKALALILADLKGFHQQWKQAAVNQPTLIRERLIKRVQQWNLSAPVDAQRLEMEVALLADKSDIAEEVQRFEAHLEEFSRLLEVPGPVGRKLDFLTQELLRETNTIASKADDLTLSRVAVDAKTAIEKLREQVQNVE